MKTPAFWSRPPGPAAWLLSPLAALYGNATARRMGRPGAAATLPVICVGNVTAGGAGKTPTALAIGRMLRDSGRRPVFLIRGYGGVKRGPLLVDPGLHGAGDVGDEALLLARVAPCVLSADRPAGARLCAGMDAGVIVMDDGLQNPSLVKDLSLAVFDAGIGIGNGLCVPAGPLRAPLQAQWPAIDAAILIGRGPPGERVADEVARQGLPLLRAGLEPDAETAAALRGRRILAFAGIGRPQKFFDTLAACGAILERRLSFPDHHVFTARQAGRVLDEAGAHDLIAVTTEKDWVRLAPLAAQEPRVASVRTLPVRLAFEDQARLGDLLAGILRS